MPFDIEYKQKTPLLDGGVVDIGVGYISLTVI